MLFFSKSFLFIFIPILAVFSFLSLKLFKDVKLYKKILIVFSIIFYGLWSYKFLILFLGLIIFNYLIANYLIIFQENKRFFYVIFAIIFNLGLLIYFKYYNFLLENINQLFSLSFNFKNIVLPLGISFIIFQQIAYLINSLNFTKKKNFTDFLFFSMFFPQIIAGPILILSDVDQQLKKNFPLLNKNNVWKGIQIFFLGIFKKVFIADKLEPLVSKVFDQNPALELGSIDMFIGLLSYGLQLYFDFSAYSDMAIGLALIFGLVLPINFNSPYKSQSISEFWGRWHITLNRFLENLIFLPLSLKFRRLFPEDSFSSKVKIITYSAMVTFFISGIWHGAGWTFILWGVYHGLFVSIHRIYSLMKKSSANYVESKSKIIFNIFLTNVVIFLSWVLFRSNDIDSAINFYFILFSIFDGSWIDIMKFENFISLAVLFALLLGCYFLPNTYEIMNYKVKTKTYTAKKSLKNLFNNIKKYYIDLVIIIFFILYYVRFSFENKPFIYYQF
jgi:alginate O-acetyltransferase complex protein AlgI